MLKKLVEQSTASWSPKGRLQDKVSLVTGGGSAIGEAHRDPSHVAGPSGTTRKRDYLTIEALKKSAVIDSNELDTAVKNLIFETVAVAQQEAERLHR
jgi:hypothetical protein